MKILITGAAGFIGSRLAEALTGHGHTVTGIDNLSTGRADNLPADFDLVEGDIRAYVPISAWDVIYHCAASYHDRSAWETDTSTNVLGTINVVREAQRAGARLVYFQTSLCYGLDPASPVRITAPLDPRGSYAISKTAGEAYIRDSGLDYVSLRLANIYGPRNLSGPIPVFHRRLSAGQPCTVVDSRRDFVYVDDLVWLAVNAATKGRGVYHVASGTDRSIEEIYRAVVAVMDLPAGPVEVVPRGADDAPSILLDPIETFETFGWIPQTPLDVGIARAVEWYEGHVVTETFSHLAMKG